MDILTQGLLGASVAQLGANRDEIKKATIIGIGAGLLADADVLIFSQNDPLLTLEFHRHFTHALIFIPLGALIASFLFWPFFKKSLPFQKIYKFSLLGYLLSGVLDALTSFGTYLYWPISNERIAWNLVSIVDPVVTILLLIGIIMGVKKCSRLFSVAALGCFAFYLLLSFLQHHRAEQNMLEVARQRGHQVDKIVLKPSLGNIVLWRSTYIADGKIHVDAIRTGLGTVKLYPGASVEHITRQKLLNMAPANTVRAHDLQRFHYFSDGYLAYHPHQADVIGDIRYSMLPNSVIPLWGIRIDTANVSRRADFVTFRDNGIDKRQQFLKMLQGND